MRRRRRSWPLALATAAVLTPIIVALSMSSFPGWGIAILSLGAGTVLGVLA